MSSDGVVAVASLDAAAAANGREPMEEALVEVRGQEARIRVTQHQCVDLQLSIIEDIDGWPHHILMYRVLDPGV